MAIAGAACGGPAPGALAEERKMSKEDCIQLGLQKNLDIRIQRLGPAIAKLTLSGDYAAYDPSFNAAYRNSFSRQPAALTAENIPIPATESTTDSLNLGLSGLIPSGLSYTIGARGSDTEGITPRNDMIEGFDNAQAFVGIDLRQPLLKDFWIDGARWNIALNRRNLRISELSLRQQVINSVTAIEEAYYSVIAARDAVMVQEIAVRLAEQLLRENRKRVEVGVLAPLDEKQAESQVAANAAALLGAQNTLMIRQNSLRNLITDDYGAWENVEIVPVETLAAPPRTFSREDSWDKGLTLRPDIQQAKLDLEKQNITLRYTKNQLFPQLDLVGSYGRVGSKFELSGALRDVTDGSGPSYSYGVEFRFPLSNRSARTRNRIAKEQIEQSLLELKKIEQGIMLEIDQLISQARTSLQQVKASEAAVAYAQQALEAEQKKLENGKSTSFQVLQLQRELTARQYDLISARTTYNIALAQLSRSEGTTLDRNNITLEID